ncbi:MAG: SDR family NAD(P)-dependent oxidoreductase [Pseudomonadota bacterium]
MAVFLTGVAGFIGAHTASKLLARGEEVIGLDNLNSYYDPALKHARMEALVEHPHFRFVEADLSDHDAMEALRRETHVDRIVHLAAQAGVRYSIENPRSYADSNLVGHTEVMELTRNLGVKHMVYASSSSVYGGNETVPFKETDLTDDPVSFYAATKKACEALSASYANLYALPQTGLRFFTVYGPWGRPDMAYMIFTKKMLAGEAINVFNNGDMGRDFTFVDDIVDGVIAALDNPPSTDQRTPHRVYNLGNDQPERLGDLIGYLEKHLSITAEKNMLPMQPGDVRETWADITRARAELGYAPKVGLEEGLERFVRWYKEYYV